MKLHVLRGGNSVKQYKCSPTGDNVELCCPSGESAKLPVILVQSEGACQPSGECVKLLLSLLTFWQDRQASISTNSKTFFVIC